jgi:hypothetical protein
MKYEELDSVETINFLYRLQWSMKSRAVSKQLTFCIGYMCSRYKKLIASTLPNSSYFIVADAKR